MLKTKRTKGLLIALVLIIALVPAVCFAGSWYTMSFDNSGTYNTSTFQNSGQPTININFTTSSSYRTYTLELQRQDLSGNWSTVDQTSGSINANNSKSVSYVSRITNTALNTYRYHIILSNNSRSYGTILYYK